MKMGLVAASCAYGLNLLDVCVYMSLCHHLFDLFSLFHHADLVFVLSMYSH